MPDYGHYRHQCPSLITTASALNPAVNAAAFPMSASPAVLPVTVAMYAHITM